MDKTQQGKDDTLSDKEREPYTIDSSGRVSPVIIQKLKGKRALVTGASGGIGKAICASLEAEGIKVCKTSTSVEDGILADLRYDIYHLCHAVLREIGTPDIIVNCAGILPRDSVIKTTDEQIHDAFAVNVFSVMRICRFFLPAMMERRSGHIINIGSSSCYSAAANRSLYAATKHAILGFTRALDDEVWRYGIRVHIISPASVNTSMHIDTPTYDRATLILPQELADAVMYCLRSDGPGIVTELKINRFGGR